MRIDILYLECFAGTIISRCRVVANQLLRVNLHVPLVITRVNVITKLGRLCDDFILIAKTTDIPARSIVAVIRVEFDALTPSSGNV
jgi:hypothetical protein